MSDDLPDYQNVALMRDLPEGRVVTVRVAGHLVGVALVGASPRVFQSLCPHDKASLKDGRIEGCEVQCPRHFARFDLESGKVSAGWRVDDLRLYPARVREGWVQVDAEALRRDPPEGQKKVWDLS
ncbi:Rieske (2Fe-2S) protein [Vannielia sp. SX4]|uniref:Rieske (2Fe-2S) protein n=1 Tax=Vannielia sp. SX4 TaxID=3463852 RepID=UPI0040597578